MAYFVITGINITPNGATPGGFGDTIFVAPGAVVAAQNDFATGLLSPDPYQTLIVGGSVGGYYGIRTNRGALVEVLPGGVVAGGNAGIGVTGTDTETVIRNSGTIRGQIGIDAAEAVTIYNSGLINGTAALYLSGGADVVFNPGTMIGNVSLLGGNDVFDGTGGRVLGTIYLGDGDDTATCGDFDDTIFGGAGNDEIDGGGGNDVFAVEALFFGTSDGNDVLDGGTGIDSYEARAASVHRVVIDLGAGVAYGVEIGTDLLSGIERALGGAGNDVLLGGSGNETLSGRDGDDLILGNGGHDRLFGGEGVNTVSGGGGNDRITGGDSSDKLNGDNGNDRIYGRYDTDVMSGGKGGDVFVFKDVEELYRNTGPSGFDRITDFGIGADRIDLSAIDANFVAAGIQDFAFIGTAPITAIGQVRYEARGGNTYVQLSVNSADVSGEIRLDGVHTLTANDFVL